MGSKASKAKRSTLTKNKALTTLRVPQDTITGTPQYTVPIPLPDPIPRIRRDTIPTIPHDIINEILDHLAKDSDLQTHRACSLISRSWVQPCQRHLFHTVRFTPASSRRWLRIFPVREESPAHYVRDIRLEIGQNARIPERFFECIPWFTDVDKMMLSGYGASLPRYGGSAPLPGPSFWKLPTSVTSLTISTAVVTLVQVRDIMAQLPNLNNLVLSGSFSVLDRRELLGIGTVLKGGFGGRLRLSGASVDEDIIDMLLEIPSGLHFAELEIYCTRSRLPPSAVRLAEACRKTIVKLSHSVAFHRKSCPFLLILARDIDPDAISSTIPPCPSRAVLRLFQVPKHSRGVL